METGSHMETPAFYVILISGKFDSKLPHSGNSRVFGNHQN
jgi:hypothetical protein